KVKLQVKFQLRKVEELEKLLNNLQQSVTKLEAENARLKSNTDKKSSATTTTQQQLTDDEKKMYDQRIERLEKRLELSRDKFNTEKDIRIQKDIELQNANIDKRIAERNEKLSKDKLNKKQEEIDDKSKKISNELNKAKTSLADVTKQSSTNRLQADSAQRALTQANEQIQQLQTSSSNLRRELDAARKEMQTNQERVLSLKNENKCFIDDITKLNKLKNSLECKIDDLERKLKEVELNNEVLKETCVVLEEQLTDYERLTSDHETRENTLVQEKMRLQKDIDDVEKKLRESKIRQNEEKTQRLIAEREIEKLESDKIDTENETDHLRQQNNEYKEKVQDLSNKLSSTTMKVDEMKCDLLDLESALEHAKTDAKQVKEESSVYLTRLHQLKDYNEALTNNLQSSTEQERELRSRITELESVFEEMRRFYSEHEFKNEGTRQQQTKLINYLQLKLEEQSNKKINFCDKIFKSKQKEQLPSLTQLNGCSMPVGYCELENQLSRERAKVKTLIEQLLDLKATIASTIPTSPTKKTTLINSPKKSNNNKNEENSHDTLIHHNLASIKRSSHKIHEFNVKTLLLKSGKCTVCNETIQVGKQVSICLHCQLITHCKCSSKAEANCGLSDGFIEYLIQSLSNSDESISTLSVSVQTLTIDESDYTTFHDNDNDVDDVVDNKKDNKNNKITMESWVKVTDNSKTLWDTKYLRLEDGYLCVYEKELLKNMSPINKINLTGKSGFSIRDTIDQTDIPGTTKSDLELIFRVEEGSRPCWSSPPRLDIMALNRVDKKSWLNALKSIKTYQHHV
ncbi:citron Rho-interacting kinase-like, partial [Aphidius gifuensis]|uniref:citron Rho-interacting kinase-like n=1 Tax=Aphidius gifuensis TaxID=684658 RepID=UPI001CDC3695